VELRHPVEGGVSSYLHFTVVTILENLMKKHSFLYQSLFRWLVVSVFLCGNMFTAQTVKAASPCSTTHSHSGLITADETWCVEGDGIHYLVDNVTVQAGVTLTIAPGVTLISGYDISWKYLTIQGHLDVLGTAAQPVIMKRYPTVVGMLWGGLYFDGSAGDGSGDINYATIEESGAPLWPSGFGDGYNLTAVLVKNLPAGKQVNISHSTIRNNASRGLFVVNSTVNVTDTTFSLNIYPILIEGAAAVVTYSGNTFSDNAYPYYDNTSYTIYEDAIFISPGALMGQSFSLPAQTGLDAYVFFESTTIPIGVTMTVDPGVTLRMAGNKYLIVQGHLDAIGAPALPILFTGIPNSVSNSNVMGNWGGINFDGSAGDGSGDIQYTNMEYAGSNWPLGEIWSQYTVLVKDLPVGKQVNISNSFIGNSISKGLYVSNGKVNVTQTTFSHNTYPILIEGAASVVTYSGNTFSDNAYPYYDNSSYTIHEDSIFISPDALMGHDFSLPVQTGLDAYVFSSGTTIPAGRIITVEPGVTLRTGSGSQFFTVQGQLNAIGTQALPIRFTGIPSSNPAVMLNWGGLIFDGPSVASGRLEHAVVEYGCGWWNSNCVTLMIYKLQANKSVVVEHSIVQNSTNVDLAVIDSPTAQVDNNLIKGGQIGVYLASNMTVSNLAVIDQVLDGVYIETGYTVDTRHLTIARTGRNGFYVNTGGIGFLKNSILSHNLLAVKAEGSAQANLDTNLMDANTSDKSGAVTDLHTIHGSAAFEADGYHIQAASAAVGRGLSGLSTLDIDGNARPTPAGSIPDLGADEILAGRFNLFLPAIKR
jgi:hypothetical protein